MAIERVNVLGVGISVINLPMALEAISDALRARHKGYICITGDARKKAMPTAHVDFANTHS